MHGAAQFASFITFFQGAAVAFTRKFDAADLLDLIEREKVLTINIVGDAMARPITEELAARTRDLSSLLVISSTGAILSGTVRRQLQDRLPNVMIMDSYGSTETGFTATGIPGSTPETGLKYQANAYTNVLGADLKPLAPGSGEIGTLARGHHIPLGYYKDPDKTAKTFVEADGERWCLAGDMATIEADGTITVYGRGSVCVNTGGEKVYTEEVEAVLKAHPSVFDAVVTGVPDERYGERVAAVVQPYPGVTITDTALDAHCRERLASYKIPRSYTYVPQVFRSPSGKTDYTWAREAATRAAGS
jgi:acyl-CoA synthetase (AMP-forming)/AMP-acid ligase II